jgi:carboxypeptidase PM20D1
MLPQTCPCAEEASPSARSSERGLLRESALPLALACASAVFAVAAAAGATDHDYTPIRTMTAAVFSSPALSALSALAVLIAVLLYNACTAAPEVTRAERDTLHQIYFAEDASRRILDATDRMAARLGEAIRFQTVSFDPIDPNNAIDYGEFQALHAWFEKTYPLVHTHLERHVINEHSLVYVWRGSEKDQQPWMAYAHTDVVPVVNKWVNSPDAFSGQVRDDGYLYGRGAIDLKNMCVGWMEALEVLLEGGFRPRRTFVLGLGHDEEIGGQDGAKQIAKWVAGEFGGDSCLEFLWDEGLFIIEDAIAGHAAPIAMICCSEKGCVSLKMTVDASPGASMHASVPDMLSATSGTPIGILSQACARLEANPMPGHSTGPMLNLLAAAAPGFRWPERLLMTNLWLFAPIVKRVLTAKHKTAAIVRTTTALTVFNAGTKVNVIPMTASCTINHRVHPGDSIEKVIDYDKRIINDHRVRLERILGASAIEPSKVSDHHAPAFADLKDMVRAVYPEAAIAPSMFLANSDSRHFWDVAPQIFRFNPIKLHMTEVKRFHGVDECIRVDGFAKVVLCFKRFFESTDRRVVPR